MSRNYQNHPELYPSVTANDPHNHHLKNSIYFDVNPINHHIVVNRTEWKAIINALDYLDVCLHGDEPVQDYVVDSLKEHFPSGLLCELSEKVARSV